MFETVELAMGAHVTTLASYFDACRRKRNMLDYDAANVVTDTEVTELLTKAEEFREQVERWIVQYYPHFAR